MKITRFTLIFMLNWLVLTENEMKLKILMRFLLLLNCYDSIEYFLRSMKWEASAILSVMQASLVYIFVFWGGLFCTSFCSAPRGLTTARSCCSFVGNISVKIKVISCFHWNFDTTPESSTVLMREEASFCKYRTCQPPFFRPLALEKSFQFSRD